MTVTTGWSRSECHQFCEVLREIDQADTETKYIMLQGRSACVTTDVYQAAHYSKIISTIEEIATTALARLNKTEVSLLHSSLERIKNQLLAHQNSWYAYLFTSTDNSPLLQQIAVLKEIFLLHSIRHENPVEQNKRRAFRALAPNARFDSFFEHVDCAKRKRAVRNHKP